MTLSTCPRTGGPPLRCARRRVIPEIFPSPPTGRPRRSFALASAAGLA